MKIKVTIEDGDKIWGFTHEISDSFKSMAIPFDELVDEKAKETVDKVVEAYLHSLQESVI